MDWYLQRTSALILIFNFILEHRELEAFFVTADRLFRFYKRFFCNNCYLSIFRTARSDLIIMCDVAWICFNLRLPRLCWRNEKIKGHTQTEENKSLLCLSRSSLIPCSLFFSLLAIKLVIFWIFLNPNWDCNIFCRQALTTKKASKHENSPTSKKKVKTPLQKVRITGDYPGGQWLKFTSQCRDAGAISGQRTKTHMLQEATKLTHWN